MINIRGLISALTSHAQSIGVFDSVNGHEPKGSPGGGLSCSIWVQEVEPIESSGLASTSVRCTFMVRLYRSFAAQPEDSIDPDMVEALDVLMSAYAGDFTLGGLIRSIDIHGSEGEPLRAQAGYLEVDRTIFRIIDITVGALVNDVWEQNA
jgi:hypothetical protein